MDTALQPQCHSGAVGREKFLGWFSIPLQEGSFYACLLFTELLPPPGLGSVSDDIALGLPNFATNGKGETLISHGRGESSAVPGDARERS